MNTLEYSIIYATIRPEIRERVSVGIIFCQDGKIEVRYSQAKLNAVRQLVSEAEYNYIRRTLVSLSTKNLLASVASIDYLNRYSNNVLTFSDIRKVKMDSPNLSKNKLYEMYVYKKVSKRSIVGGLGAVAGAVRGHWARRKTDNEVEMVAFTR